MADPIKEQLIQTVRTRLLTLTVANGYQETVVSVQRRTSAVDELTPEHLGIIMDEQDENPSGGPAGLTDWSLPIDLWIFIAQSVKVKTPIYTALNTFEADVKKCLMSDAWRVGLAGLLIDVSFSGPRSGATKDALEFVVVRPRFHYRHSETDPFSLT